MAKRSDHRATELTAALTDLKELVTSLQQLAEKQDPDAYLGEPEITRACDQALDLLRREPITPLSVALGDLLILIPQFLDDKSDIWLKEMRRVLNEFAMVAPKRLGGDIRERLDELIRQIRHPFALASAKRTEKKNADYEIIREYYNEHRSKHAPGRKGRGRLKSEIQDKLKYDRNKIYRATRDLP